MEVISTPEGKSSVRLEIVMPADTVAAAIGTAVRAVAQRSKIPGFRPGKAPRAVVERFAGIESILDEATEILVERGYRDAVLQKEIVPLTSPTLEAKAAVEGEPYRFVAIVPVPPEVQLGDYRNFKFTPAFEEPDAAKVDRKSTRLNSSHT